MIMRTECRNEFEVWATREGRLDLTMDGVVYESAATHFAWMGWRAAWHYLKGHDET